MPIGPTERGAFRARSFDKDGDDRRRDIPAERLGRRIEEFTVTLRRRQELDILKSAHIHAQSTRVLEKKLGMRLSCDKPAGFFFVEIFRQAAANLRDRDIEYKIARRESESRARRCHTPVRSESAVALAPPGLK